MKTLLNESKQYFTTTLSEAESLLEQLKEEYKGHIKKHSITKKSKKDIDFYIVNVVIEYYKARDLIITE